MRSAAAPLVSAAEGAAAGDAERPAALEGGINLEWADVECFVEEKKESSRFRKFLKKTLGVAGPAGRPTKCIVRGASGFARSGEVLAVMGPSGAGKTTLLNVLAQRPTLGTTGYWKGKLLLNGLEPWKDWEREMAYVMQKDIFYEQLKVQENLLTTALLRLPYHWTRERKVEYLNQSLDDLGLGKVKDTKIGTAIDRGLSGGEVKRTSIANECLALPRIFMLDEPLTGLDSSRAVDVMRSLRKMARERGTTVMLTIHQPSSALYECFDRLLLLGPGGRTAFFGSVGDAVEHFTSIGRPVPALWTPTDHYIEVLSVPANCDEVCELWQKAEHPVPPPPMPKPPSSSPMPPVHYQVRVLLPRSFMRIKRSYLTRLNFKLHVSLAFVFGIVYFNVGRKMPQSLNDYVGAIFFIVAHWSWTPLFQGLGNFPRDKEVLTKEKASKVYGIWSYFVSQTAAEAPLLLVLPVVFFLVMWPLTGLDWWVFPQVFLMIALNIQVCSSLSMLISAVCMDPDTGIPAAIVVMVLEMCSGGYFADMRRLPWWISWIRYVSVYYYTFGATTRLLVTVPFGQEVHEKAIARYSFSDLGYAMEVGALLAQVLIFRLLSYLVLRFTKKLRFT